MNQRRRVRQEVADAAVLMAFSAGVSVAIAVVLGVVVALTAGAS